VVTHQDSIGPTCEVDRALHDEHVVVPFGSGSLFESGGNHKGFGLGERRIQNEASEE
jgi:hypothetical protein